MCLLKIGLELVDWICCCEVFVFAFCVNLVKQPLYSLHCLWALFVFVLCAATKELPTDEINLPSCLFMFMLLYVVVASHVEMRQ